MSKLSQRQELQQKLTPKQILKASLLQLNLPLLEQRILHEIEINPALEMLENKDELEEESNVEEEELQEHLEYHNQYSVDVISMGKELKLQKCRTFAFA